MKAEWRSATIQEFVERGEVELKTGPFGTQLHASDYVEHGTPVINVRNIGLGTIVPEKLEYISDQTAERLASHLLQADDIVFGRKGAVERHAFVKSRHARWFQGSDCMRLRVKSQELIALFLSYCFLTEDHKQWMMNQCSHGATMASLNQAIIGRISLRLPPLLTQERIVSILSAYDDLIENNTRRIKILEDMAQVLYREWFVNFRFPGHENVRMVESELGPIPEGWTVRCLREVTSYINRGISPKYDDSASGWVINQKCIRDHRLNLGPARKQSKPVPADKVVRKGDILINSTGVGTLGRVAQVHQDLVDFTVDSHVSIVRPMRNANYLGEVALQLEPSFEAMGTGSTGQTELGRERIAATLFVCPPEVLQTYFSRHVESSHQLSLCLSQKNVNLLKTRDLLLPKLISGEIPVEAADDKAAKLLEQTA
jgi:type I restriction enzyme S subunit